MNSTTGTLAVISILLALAAGPIEAVGPMRDSDTSSAIDSASADGITLYVGGSGPGNYSSIQAAVDDASDGDTVYVYNGTYQETVTIQPSIQLVGEYKHGTVIDAVGSGTAVAIQGDGTVMTRFTVTGSAGGGQTAAVQIHGDHVIFDHNVVRDNEHHGILLTSASGCRLSRNVITDNSYHGVHIVNASDGNNVTHNEIASGMAGVYIGAPHPQTVSFNSISNSTKGVYLEESHGNAVLGNHIAGSQEGIFCSYAPGNAIQRNNFISNARHARFVTFVHRGFLTPNRWSHNYWDDWTGVGGKAIPGAIYVPTPALIGVFIPWLNVDWRPAAEPYEHPME